MAKRKEIKFRRVNGDLIGRQNGIKFFIYHHTDLQTAGDPAPAYTVGFRTGYGGSNSDCAPTYVSTAGYQQFTLEGAMEFCQQIAAGEITVRDALKGGSGDLWPEEEETVAVMGLLHDVCKLDVYHRETKRRRNKETGKWEDYQGYSYRDPFPLGHGEKSVFLIMRHMALTEEEALAIRWHMGAYDYAAKGGDKALDAAMDVTPWVWRLHEADMCASRIDERGAAE